MTEHKSFFASGEWCESRGKCSWMGVGEAGLPASGMLPGDYAMDTKTSLLVALAVVVLMLIGFGLFPL
jgi:hypothetical protein